MDEPENHLWRIKLFGGPILTHGSAADIGLTKFRSVKVAGLLAYLAMRLGTPCSRAALVDALWPDEVDQKVLSNRFRVTLASLRRQLEPTGTPFGSVLDTSIAGTIRLRRETVWCDYHEYQIALAKHDLPLAAKLQDAPLLPGFQEEWVTPAQLDIDLLADDLAPYRARDGAAPGTQQTTWSIGHLLPLYLTRFIDHSSITSDLKAMIEDQRLVTVTGIGGVGKTRTLVEVCASSSKRTIFIPLTASADIAATLSTTLSRLGFEERDWSFLGEEALFVSPSLGDFRIFFDCPDEVPALLATHVQSLLAAGPQLSIVIASREPLLVPGEQIFQIFPMLVQSVAHGSSKLAIAPIDLFMDRARRSRPDFKVSEVQADLIHLICEKLGGLPLAIELVAAQIALRSLQDILHSLEDSVLGLHSRQRGITLRHRSLRAAFEPSIAQLSGQTAKFLSVMATCKSGFTAQSARAISDDTESISHLSELVHRSLVTADIEPWQTRYTILEAVGELALEKLSASEAIYWRSRHKQHFLELAANVDEDNLRTVNRLDYEEANLNMALTPFDSSDRQQWLAGIGQLVHAFLRGRYRVSLASLRQRFDSISDCPCGQVRRDWCLVASQILIEMGQFEEAERVLSDVSQNAQVAGDRAASVHVAIANGLICARQDRISEALSLHRRALNEARILGSAKLLDSALAHLSGTLHQIGRMPGSTGDILLESESLALELVSRVGRQSRRYSLGLLLAGVASYYLQDFESARERLLRASVAANEAGLGTIQMYTSFFRAAIASRDGNSGEATGFLEQFLDIEMQSGISIGKKNGAQREWFTRTIAEITTPQQNS